MLDKIILPVNRQSIHPAIVGFMARQSKANVQRLFNLKEFERRAI